MEINNSSLVIINASVQAIVHLSKKYRYSDPQLSHELNEIHGQELFERHKDE